MAAASATHCLPHAVRAADSRAVARDSDTESEEDEAPQQPRDSDTESEEDEAPGEDEEEEVAPMRVTRARAGATTVLA